MRAWLRRIWARRFWHRLAVEAEGEAPLREFIYLDEVSVYSLLASRRGAVPSEQTDSATAQIKQAVDAEAGVTTGVAKSTGRSQFETTSTRGTQVLRKSIIQATFKDLVELEKERMKVRDGVVTSEAPSFEHVDDLLGSVSEHVVPCSSLTRGDLLEFEVELAPEDIFTASQIVNAMFVFFEDSPELFSVSPEMLKQGRAIDTIFERLLTGLVPLRARLARYRRVAVRDQELLVSTALIETNPALRELEPQPVYIVGVAEQPLFWRDLRRVLFSGSRFFVMCRLSKTGLQSTWRPIKFANVFERQVPAIADVLDELPTMFLSGMQEGMARPSTGTSDQQEIEQPALTELAERLAEEAGDSWTVEDSSAIGLDQVDPRELESLDVRRDISNRIVERLEGRLDQRLDRVAVARLRGAVLHSDPEDRVWNGGGHSPDPAARADADGSGRLLETEIVAIYW